MKNALRRFPFTFASVGFAIIVVAAALIGHTNVIQIPIGVMNRVEQGEVDDIVTARMLVGVRLSLARTRFQFTDELETGRASR